MPFEVQTSDSYITNAQINVISRIHVSKEKKGRKPMTASPARSICCDLSFAPDFAS